MVKKNKSQHDIPKSKRVKKWELELEEEVHSANADYMSASELGNNDVRLLPMPDSITGHSPSWNE